MIVAAAGARSKYMHHLDEQKRMKTSTEKQNKRKSLLGEIEELKTKKKRTESAQHDMIRSADKLSEEAEKISKLNLLSKANSKKRCTKKGRRNQSD